MSLVLALFVVAAIVYAARAFLRHLVGLSSASDVYMASLFGLAATLGVLIGA